MIKSISVNEPIISKNARKYLLECLKSGWVSSHGPFIERFEKEFAKYIGVKYAVTTTNGTAALHLALAALGVGKGDEVIVPDLTIISCALAVIYTGAVPVFVDVDPSTGNIDSGKIEEKLTSRTKAIMVVHLYGHPADMSAIVKIVKKHRLLLVEDAAQAHGAQVQIQNSKVKSSENLEWKKVGGIGVAGCFSFYANKIVTSGEGGMVVTNRRQVYEKLKLLKDLAHHPKKRFKHMHLGFNYRMTNLQAALGLAQLENVDKYVAKKRWMAQEYKRQLEDVGWLELPQEVEWAQSVYWMYAVKITQKSKVKSQNLRNKLSQLGIDTRGFFYPMHSQPVLKKMGLVKTKDRFPVSSDLSKRGFYLPSGLAITKEQIGFVSDAVKRFTAMVSD